MKKTSSAIAKKTSWWCAVTGLALTVAQVAVAAPTVSLISNPQIIVSRPGLYDYAPVGLYDSASGHSELWWLGDGNGNTGDFLFAGWSTAGPSGPFQNVFARIGPTTGSYEATWVGDPGMVRDGTTEYCWYGGRTSGYPGRVFMKYNNGDGVWRTSNGPAPQAPQIHPKSPDSWGNCYGAGQPSIVKDGSYYYLIFTCVYRTSPGGSTSSGVYMVRATNATFTTGLQEFQTSGWVNITRSATDNSIQMAYNRPLVGGGPADMIRLDGLGRFMLTMRQNSSTILCRMFSGDGNFTWLEDFTIATPTYTHWKEQASVRSANATGHVAPNAGTSNKQFDLQIYGAHWDGIGDVNSIWNYDIATMKVRVTFP